ncbi:iron complex transport system permease protein [Gordonia amarae]|uniref:Putative ABC transporter permease protein n=1 Tax=Gordonia amarae NBRC 15530 TaxID=1075090 RepID=G7GNK1_9ACTN|nr:iron chelate uptake ABC transporter family permease subunit [Gordonia amarae]MCS3878238.1 iron complex transport system permease protein [Gordonia amarae]GAB05176.1 putative ABC transporter permease protein [Gordonia amarae NBRC 15530]
MTEYPAGLVRRPEDDAPALVSAHAGNRRRGSTYALWWFGFALVVVLLAWLSLFVGARPVSAAQVWDALFAYAGSSDRDQEVVVGYRIPRALLAVVVGGALGMAGSLIQRLMRNPLGDPQILGVNAGASFAVAVAVGFLGLTSTWSYIWFAFAGAVAAMAIVYGLGSAGRGRMTPVRVTMAGVAVTAVLTGAVRGIGLLNPDAFDALRIWEVGSLIGRDNSVLLAVLPFVVVGAILAMSLARPLDAISMGDDLATAMGVPVRRVRLLTIIAVVLLCGAATAAAGPIGFVGLMVPHAVRMLAGVGGWWLTAFSMLGGAALVLVSDVVGRVLVRPDEVPVGIVTAFVGAPILVILVRRLSSGTS